MVILLLLIALLAAGDGVRTYHPVPLATLGATRWTHVETCGTVVLVKHEADGDIHIGLQRGTAHAVAEIIPSMPRQAPAKGQTIQVRGISRLDKTHHWPEVHPVEAWTVVARCQ